MRIDFDKKHCIKLPGFMEAELLQTIQHEVNLSEFDRNSNAIAVELRMENNSVLRLLQTVVNNEKLFDLIEQITGYKQICYFAGRVYRIFTGAGHYDSWHDDAVKPRVLAMSINLSTDIYSGGLLQIRDSKSKKILSETANTGFGDAIIFRISDDLEHRLTDVEGKVPKTAFAGWFGTQPNWSSFFKRRPTYFTKNGKRLLIKKHSTIITAKMLSYNNLDGNFFIFNPANERCFSLDHVGTSIWNLLQEPKTVNEIKDFILKEYDIEQTKCENDLLTLLEELATNELIVVEEARHLSALVSSETK